MSTPSSWSVSFSDAFFYKAKAVAETEKAQEGYAHRAQTTTMHKLRNTRDDEEDKEELKLCIPTSASGITAALLHVRHQVWALSILRCHWYAREPLAADAGDEQISALKIQ